MKTNITKGKVHKFEDDINTDYIISSRNKRDTTDFNILKNFIFEDIRNGFIKKMMPGDVIAAGYNFGCGSAMEVAAGVVKAAGFKVIIAKSFARSYYRNCINNGLILIQTDTDFLNEGDIISIDVKENGELILSFENKDKCIPLGAVNQIMFKLYQADGLIGYINQYGRFPV